jgi:membrane protein implicated in regulation of membrane protease activity
MDVSNSLNWILLIVGVLAFAAEVVLGAATGFDLALLGASLAAGGAAGLMFGSAKVGLFSAGALAFIYLAFLRKRIRAKLTSPHTPTNTDALLGKSALVTERIAPHVPGKVRVGDEIWRARLANEAEAEPAREPGAMVTVDAVEGVTLKVR